MHFEKIQREILRVAKLGGVSVTEPGRWGPVMVLDEYQQVRFGGKRLSERNGGSKSYRGYLMIEPEKLFDSLARLNWVGEQRLKKDKKLEYKWVLPDLNRQTSRIKSVRDLHPVAEALYTMLPTAQLATLYADTPREIHDIFESLVVDTGWDAIEAQKRLVVSKINMEKPQHGQERFEYQGKDFMSLELNEAVGFAELQTSKENV